MADNSQGPRLEPAWSGAGGWKAYRSLYLFLADVSLPSKCAQSEPVCCVTEYEIRRTPPIPGSPPTIASQRADYSLRNAMTGSTMDARRAGR
jgi:hypothetical protein